VLHVGKHTSATDDAGARKSRHRPALSVADLRHPPELLRVPLRPLHLPLVVLALQLRLAQLLAEPLGFQGGLRRSLRRGGLQLGLELLDLLLQSTEVLLPGGFELLDLLLLPVHGGNGLLEVFLELLLGLCGGVQLLLCGFVLRGYGGELGMGLGQGGLQALDRGGAGDGLVGGLLQLLLQLLF